MSRIYIEPSAITLGGSPELPAGGESWLPTPGALDALGNLRDAGHDVAIVLGPEARTGVAPAQLPWATDLAVAHEIDPVPGTTSWLITGDPRWCERRRPGVRTILVGPRRPPGPRPTAHCDVAARDLSAAVIEILTREAMA